MQLYAIYNRHVQVTPSNNHQTKFDVTTVFANVQQSPKTAEMTPISGFFIQPLI